MNRALLIGILFLALLFEACKEASKYPVAHRRNLSKEYFEDEFKKIKVTCDSVNQTIYFEKVQRFQIDDKFLDKKRDDYRLKMKEKMPIKEGKFTHELYLEKVNPRAWMFRYNSEFLDTLSAPNEKNPELKEDILLNKDKGRVICACDEVI